MNRSASVADPDVDCIVQQIQNLFKFKNFYGKMNFIIGQRLATKKKTIELANSLGGLYFV